MTEKERGRRARDIGYEAARYMTDAMLEMSATDDGTVDAGVYYAAMGFAANVLLAQLNADTMLNSYPQSARVKAAEDVGE